MNSTDMQCVIACTACLATDVGMTSLSHGALLQAYERVTGLQIHEGMPRQLCWECAALVHKFNMFRDKCDRSQRLLYVVCSYNQNVTEEVIRKIDRIHHKLTSRLSISPVNIIDMSDTPHYTNMPDDEISIKCEKIDIEEVEIGKPEPFLPNGLKFEAEMECEVMVRTPEDCFRAAEEPITISERPQNTDGRGFYQESSIARILSDQVTHSNSALKNNKKYKAVASKAEDFKATEVSITPEEARAAYTERKKSKKFANASLKCPDCFLSYSHKELYEKHRLRHDSSRGAYECDTCKLRCKTRMLVRKHIYIRHMRKYICNICSSVSYTKKSAKNHYRWHETGGYCRARKIKKNKRRIKVAVTKERYATEVVLTQEQMMTAVRERQNAVGYSTSRYKCTLCYKVFCEQRHFSKHMLLHEPASGAFECDLCKIRIATRCKLYGHITQNHMKKYSCDMCSYVCYNWNGARQHFFTHQKRGQLRAQGKRKISKQLSDAKPGGCEMTPVVLTQEQMAAVVRDRQNAAGYNSSRYKCTFCYKAFNEENAFSNHMLQHDPVSGPLECDICKIRIKTRSRLQSHISEVHMKKYLCNICPHVCYNRNAALKHIAWHQGVTYTCQYCGVTTKNMSTYRNHLRIKHPSPHACGECGESFVSKLGLYHHFRKMHSRKQDSDAAAAAAAAAGPYCGACDVQFASAAAWTRHILLSPKHEHEKRALEGRGCRDCGETFAGSAELQRHRSAQHRRRDYAAEKFRPSKCAQCDEIMLTATKYWQHFRLKHAGMDFPLTRSSYICEYCGKWFKHKSTLEIHARTHLEANERAHRCTECPKRFVKPESLAAHALSHTDSGRFSCDVCGRQFMYKHSLTNHFRTHTTEKPRVCGACGKTFAYEDNLKRHELTTHNSALAPSGSD